jgi:hypothetical protein
MIRGVCVCIWKLASWLMGDDSNKNAHVFYFLIYISEVELEQ